MPRWSFSALRILEFCIHQIQRPRRRAEAFASGREEPSARGDTETWFRRPLIAGVGSRPSWPGSRRPTGRKAYASPSRAYKWRITTTESLRVQGVCRGASEFLASKNRMPRRIVNFERSRDYAKCDTATHDLNANKERRFQGLPDRTQSPSSRQKRCPIQWRPGSVHPWGFEM